MVLLLLLVGSINTRIDGTLDTHNQNGYCHSFWKPVYHSKPKSSIFLEKITVWIKKFLCFSLRFYVSRKIYIPKCRKILILVIESSINFDRKCTHFIQYFVIFQRFESKWTYCFGWRYFQKLAKPPESQTISQFPHWHQSQNVSISEKELDKSESKS